MPASNNSTEYVGLVTDMLTASGRLPVEVGGDIVIENVTLPIPQVGPVGDPVPPQADYVGVRAPDGTLVPLLRSAEGRLLVDTGLSIPQPQTDALTNAQLRAVPVPVSFPPDEAGLTNAELRNTPVSVTVTNPAANPETGLAKDSTLREDRRTLTERMFARAPASTYSLYLDTADAVYIYIAEGPTADTAATATTRGVRVTKDALGNPVGRVQQAQNFAWNDRSTAAWT